MRILKYHFSITILLSFFLLSSLNAAEIHDTVHLKDIVKVKAMLAANPSLINSRSKVGMTPLHQSAAVDAADIAALLISKGADPSATTLNGITPLHLAIRNKSINALRVLITKTSIIYTTSLFSPRSLKSNERDKAHYMITQLLRDDPANENINFASGMINAAISEYSHANMAFERTLQLNPKNDRARLELARTYIATKQLALAKEQLMTVHSHNPPPKLKSTLSQYVRLLKRSVKRWSLSTRIDTGVFVDDNVNVGPNASIISIKPVVIGSTLITDFALAKESQAADSVGYSAMLTLSAAYDIAEQGAWQITSEGAYYKTWLEKEFRDYENAFGLVSFGAKKSSPTSILHLKLTGSFIETGGDPLVNMYGLNPSHTCYLDSDGKTLLSSTLTLETRDYDTLNYRDSTYIELDETFKWYIGANRNSVSLGGTIAMDDTDSDAYKYVELGVNIGGELNLPWRTTLYADVAYASSEYDKAEDLAPKPRSDDEILFTAGISKIITAHSGINLNHQFTDNNSSFDLYEYDRNITTVTVYVAF